MSFHPHMTAPGSGFGHMKFMKDMKGMMNMMEQLKKHNKDGEVSPFRPSIISCQAARTSAAWLGWSACAVHCPEWSSCGMST